ncbi:hypothetical protein Taro_043555 [Colocasia esculenta]|uniref:DNA-directed RNA polymerase n=1 Tax=Colocasia esculenta TaxID=4460 RepID=A0A843WW35_COLES|nr:hypothetical protein [Colocasia esculenta]
MERNYLLAYGAAANLHERLFTLSDSSQMHICQTCTRVANVIQRPVPGGKKVRGPYCPFCQSSENIVKISVPYGAKLLYQELFSMEICLKFKIEATALSVALLTRQPDESRSDLERAIAKGRILMATKDSVTTRL